MTYRRLPNRRALWTLTFQPPGEPVHYVSYGRFDDGALSEIFLDVGKPGTDLNIVAKASGILASMALRNGIPVKAIRRALPQTASGLPLDPLGRALAQIPASED